MRTTRVKEKKEELRQPPNYISPVIKLNPITCPSSYSIDIEATSIIEVLINPRFINFHAMFPAEKTAELRLSIARGTCLEINSEPFVQEIYFLSNPIKEINFFLNSMERVLEIALRYYGIEAKRPNGSKFWSFTKSFDAGGDSIIR